MSEKATTSSTPASPASPKKQAATTKKPRVKPNHPPTSEMVLSAVKSLKERNGSSLQAIKKYIVATYTLEAEKLAPFIKKYLKNAVDQGVLIQTKGKGASGSFKLPVAKSEAGKTKPRTARAKPAAKKVVSAKKPKATTVEKKKTIAAKKPVAAAASTAKKTAAKKPVAKKAAATKPPAKKSIAKKSAKSPAAKPKAPKPKKSGGTKSAKTATKK